MSSHHFVKEQQEPALLILQTASIGYEQLTQLLEWVPTILVAQAAVETVLSWGIKIDVILADQSFINENLNLLEEHYPVSFKNIQIDSILEEAVLFLGETAHSAVNVIGLDHQKIFGFESVLGILDVVIWDGPLRYFPVKNGSFKKWFPACSIQLHGPENLLVEMISSDGSSFIQIRYATFITLEEGNTAFNSSRIFWIGEFTQIQ